MGKFTDSDKLKILELRLKHQISSAEIARRYNVTRECIRQLVLSVTGSTTRLFRNPVMPSEKIEEIYKLFENGTHYATIARYFKISPVKIINILDKKFGKHTHGGVILRNREEIKAMYASGELLKVIAGKYNITLATLCTGLTKLGVKKNRKFFNRSKH